MRENSDVLGDPLHWGAASESEVQKPSATSQLDESSVATFKELVTNEHAEQMKEIGIRYHNIIMQQDTTLNAIKEDVKYMSQHEIENLFKHHLSMLRLDAIPLFNNPPLESSNLIDHVFRRHKLFSNIINYHLLHRIVDKCGGPTTRNDMMKFIEEVKCFMKSTRLKDSLYLCQDIKKIDGFTALVIQHRLESDALLSDLDVFRQNFCEAFKISEVSMFFITAKLEEETAWFVPSYLWEQLLSEIKILENSSLLNDLDITALHFGEYTYHTSRSKKLGVGSESSKRVGESKRGSDALKQPQKGPAEAIMDRHIVFADRPPTDLLDHTGRVILHPYTTTCCGYLIMKEASQVQDCPKCGKHTEIMYDRSSHQRVKALKVHCKCGSWTGNLSDLNNHMKKDCSHAFINCPNSCGEKVQKGKLEYHKVNDCSKRSHNCPYCGMTSTYEDITKDHLPQCAETIVPCPNKCGNEAIQHKQLKKHIDQCPKTTLKCEYSLVGCVHNCKQQLMDKHLKSEKALHQEMALQLESKIQALTVSNKMFKKKYFTDVQTYSIPEFTTRNIWTYESWTSEPFYSQLCSYKMFIKLCGYNPEKTDLEVSIHVVNAAFDKELNTSYLGNITLELFDHSGNYHHYQKVYTFDQHEIHQDHACSLNFISYEKLVSNTQDYQYLKENQITLRVVNIEMKKRKESTTLTEVQKEVTSLLEQCKQMCKQLEILEQQNSMLQGIKSKSAHMCFYAEYPTFIMDNYSYYSENQKTWLSDDGFYTQLHGYKLRLEVNAAGTGEWYGNHISVGLHLMKGDYDGELTFPFCGEIAIELVDRKSNNHVTKSLIFDINSRKAGSKTDRDMYQQSCEISDFVAVEDVMPKYWINFKMTKMYWNLNTSVSSGGY
ncbi:hypothetical protein EMCRGX_G013834 [Ephydatia muelleri]